MAVKKNLYGFYDDDRSPDYNYNYNVNVRNNSRPLKEKDHVRREEKMQRGMEEKTKTFFIGEENWRKIIQCWEDFIDQEYEDRADALFSLIEELMHENDPPVE